MSERTPAELRQEIADLTDALRERDVQLAGLQAAADIAVSMMHALQHKVDLEATHAVTPEQRRIEAFHWLTRLQSSVQANTAPEIRDVMEQVAMIERFIATGELGAAAGEATGSQAGHADAL